MASLAALVTLALVAPLVPVLQHNQTGIQPENMAFRFPKTSAKFDNINRNQKLHHILRKISRKYYSSQLIHALITQTQSLNF